MRIKPLLLAVVLAVLTTVVLANSDFWKSEWPGTNFSKITVPYWNEFLSGGPAKDGILASDNPTFIRDSDERRIKIASWSLPLSLVLPHRMLI